MRSMDASPLMVPLGIAFADLAVPWIWVYPSPPVSQTFFVIVPSEVWGSGVFAVGGSAGCAASVWELSSRQPTPRASNLNAVCDFTEAPKMR